MILYVSRQLKEEYILMTEVGTDTYTAADHFVASPFNTYGPGLNGTNLENGLMWKYLYLALSITNSTLEFLPKSTLTDKMKTVREAEVRFLRAYYLWNITEIWGPAHLSTESVKSKQLTAYNTPVETFYDQIFKDLNFAEANLDDDELPSDYGRVTKWAARAALARMYFIAAEAKHFLGDNDETDGAAYYLNVIRRRAAMSGKEADMEITEADINLDFILDEKGREFAGEYIRWFDLKRTNKLIERVRLHNPDCSDNIDEHHMVRPIPQTQLNSVTNTDEFKQNPGYN